MSERTGARGREGAVLGALLLAALLARVAFVAAQGLPIFDPWRHLELIRNLRAGLGFTLFDGQPYIWHAEAWYRLCALSPRWLKPQWLGALLSWLSVAGFWLWLGRTEEGEEGRRTALAGAALAAGFGPLVAFTCHYGPEALALFLLLAALALAAALPGVLAAAGSGLLFGTALAARMNLAFDAFLFLPALGSRRRALAFAGGTALPLAGAWFRNHRAIAANPYLFTWDGLATRTADFNPVSTLLLQMHPAIEEGLKRLHAQVVPFPEWIAGPSGIAWGPLLFMAGGAACVLSCRRWSLALAGLSTASYFLFFDGSRSSNFFRIWLGLFPVLLAAVATVAARLKRLPGLGGTVASWALLAATIATGAAFFRPPAMVPIELVTPSPELLAEDAYMVNSSFYQPESLIWRFHDKRFIGMPLDPSQFDDFRRRYPKYRCVLWHDFSVQDDLLAYLMGAGGFEVARSGVNDYGRAYAVLCPEGGARPNDAPVSSRPASGGGGGSSTR
jgi:hypothetical protein